MNHIVPVKEYSSVSAMQDSYAAIRKRLYKPLPPVKPVVTIAPCVELPIDFSKYVNFNFSKEQVIPVDVKLPEVFGVLKIAKHVAKAYNIDLIDLLSVRRTRDVVFPRQVVMYLCKRLTVKSLPQIGRQLGNRDHTTVLHGIRMVEALIAKDKVAARKIGDLVQELRPKELMAEIPE